MMSNLLEKGNLELLSNILFLSESPITDYIACFEHGSLPEFLLPVFLHEATHHWCLTSIVGNALAVNELKIQRAFLDSDGLLESDSLALWSKMSAIRRLLEPLLEGLALFADFDAYSGSSTIVSAVQNWAAILFTRSLKIEIPTTMPLERLRYLLCAYRSSEIAMRRKSDILVRPLTTANGGYLLGYLTVKNIWSNSLKRSKRLADSDLFLAYLRSIVFEDPIFADMILGQSDDAVNSINALMTHFHQRLKLLGSQDIEDRVERFERSIAETGTLDDHWESVFIKEKARKKTTEQLSERLGSPFRELLKPVPYLDALLEKINKELDLPNGISAPKKRERLLNSLHRSDINLAVPRELMERAIIDAAPMLHRTLVRIRVDRVNVQVGADHKCTVSLEASPLFTTSAREDVPEGSGPGLFALYFLPDYGTLALICVKDNYCVFTIFPENVPDFIRGFITLTVSQVLLNEKGRIEIPSLIRQTREFLAENSGDSQEIEAQLEDVITNLYLNHATCFVSDQKLDSCLKPMQENGFWQLFDENGDRVSSLAALGLISSFTPMIDHIDALMRLHEFDLPQTIKELKTTQDRFGYPLLLTWEKTLRCLV